MNHRQPIRRTTSILCVASALALIGISQPAAAVDGCTVLLCLAAPSWGAIPQCVPPIRELFRDLARGRVFPTCGMSGPGNSAAHQWANPPTYWPRLIVTLQSLPPGLSRA